MEGPLQKGGIAECIEKAGRVRIALQTPAAMSEENHRNVRPFRLGFDPRGQSAKVRTEECLLRHEHKSRTVIEFSDQSFDRIAGQAFDTGLLQYAGSYFAVTSRWREN